MSKIQKFAQYVWTIEADNKTTHIVRLQEKDGVWSMEIEQYYDGSHTEIRLVPTEARDLMNAIRCALYKCESLS